MILKELKIDTWIGDPTNCYVIFDEESKEIISKTLSVFFHIAKNNIKLI